MLNKIFAILLTCSAAALPARPFSTEQAPQFACTDSVVVDESVSILASSVGPSVSPAGCGCFDPCTYRFQPVQLIDPLALFAVGSLGTFVRPFQVVNTEVRDAVNDFRGNHKTKIDDWIQYVPTAAHLFLGFTKMQHRSSFKERLAVDITSALSLAILTNALKYSFREQRPDADSRNSFPSGHTATAFMGAELMRIEYGNCWGGVAYGVASLVGVMRVYNGRHWVNDVIAGAGIGILAARIGYWMLPVYQKWFHWKQTQTGQAMAALPGYDAATRSMTLNFAMTF